jgi:hypothetical protein
MTLNETPTAGPDNPVGSANVPLSVYVNGTPSDLPRSTVGRRELAFGGSGIALGLAAGIAGSLLISSLAGGLSSLVPDQSMADAATTCDVETNSWIVLGDEGQSIAMQSEGAEASGADYADVLCILDALDVPDSVLNRIDNTRALDGRQSATWDQLTASWGYHPDNGLDIVIDASAE